MSNLWDRPSNSAIPLRSIDRHPEPIFEALGRAVSNWEGVQAAVTEVFLSLLDHQDIEVDQQALDEFGRILRVPDRAKAIRDRTDEFFGSAENLEEGFEATFRSALLSSLKAYEGWTQRRNDLAHGYVTEWEAPDYSDDNQPIVTFFGLLPSHARTRKWFMYEPEYNYIAEEVEGFADAFLELDDDLARLARKMNKARGFGSKETWVLWLTLFILLTTDHSISGVGSAGFPSCGKQCSVFAFIGTIRPRSGCAAIRATLKLTAPKSRDV